MKKNSWSVLIFLLLPLVVFAAAFFGAREIEGRTFDYGIDAEKAEAWMVTLSGEKLEGRQTGTAGGEMAAAYIAEELERQGIEAAFGNDGYMQTFDTITPLAEWDEFSIAAGGGERAEFKLYEDFSIMTDGYGGGIDYRGDILFVDRSVYEIPEEMIGGKVVAVKMNQLAEDTVEYILDHGGLGIIYFQDNMYDEFHVGAKDISISDKRAETIFIAQITRKAYNRLYAAAIENLIEEYSKKRVPGNIYSGSVVGVVEEAVIKGDIGFPLVKGVNLAGWIPARSSDEYMVLATNYDGYGTHTAGGHVPGSVDNAGGVAALLALSENLQGQGAGPGKNIVLLFLDGSKLGAAGLGHYIDNPAFPLEKSEFIILDKLGWKGAEKTWVGYDIVKEERYSPMLAEKLVQYFQDAGVEVAIERFDQDMSLGMLEEEGIPAVRVASVHAGEYAAFSGTPMDGPSQWDGGVFAESMKGGMNFLARTQYGIVYPSYADERLAWILTIAFMIVYAIYAISLMRKNNPAARLAGATADDLYFSMPYMLAARLLYVLAPVAMAFLFVVFIVNIPPFFNMADSPAGVKSNFSAYAVLKRVYHFVKGFGPGVLSHKWDGIEAGEILPAILLRSAFLTIASTILSFAVGTAKGIADGMRQKGKTKIGGVMPIAISSIPEVLIILVALYLLVPLSNLPFAADLIGAKNLRLYVMPILSLVIIPTVYFSRLVRIAVEEEKEKVYVRYAKSMGFGTFSIVTRHMLRGIMIKAAAGLPALATMIVSSQIVVEYLFGYPGMINYLFNNRANPEIVLTICMLLGAVYASFAAVSKVLCLAASPKGVD